MALVKYYLNLVNSLNVAMLIFSGISTLLIEKLGWQLKKIYLSNFLKISIFGGVVY